MCELLHGVCFYSPEKKEEEENKNTVTNIQLRIAIEHESNFLTSYNDMHSFMLKCEKSRDPEAFFCINYFSRRK